MTETQPVRTREQKYAATVYALVQNFDHSIKDEKQRVRYASLCHSVAIMIRSAGLVQALAFACRKQDQGNQQFVRDLAQALGYSGDNNQLKLLEASYTASLMEYMYLTQDTLAVLLWFKRFAQSILKVEQGTQVEED